MRYEGDNFYFKTREEMEQLFPDDTDALDRRRDRRALQLPLPQGANHYPRFDRRPRPASSCWPSPWSAPPLRRQDVANPADDADALMKRFNYEVDIIEKTGFLDYFLVVSDFVRYTAPRASRRRARLRRQQRRGLRLGDHGDRAAQAPPDLRALPQSRPRLMPDFDIDCQSRRSGDRSTSSEYGADRVAQIATFGHHGARRHRHRACAGDPLADAIAHQLIPDDPKTTLKTAAEQNRVRDGLPPGSRSRTHHATSAGAGGPLPQRRHARHRRGHRRLQAQRRHPPHQGQGGLADDAVRQGGRRGLRPAEDGLPRAQDADGTAGGGRSG